jgi:hypothetical protein
LSSSDADISAAALHWLVIVVGAAPTEAASYDSDLLLLIAFCLAHCMRSGKWLRLKFDTRQDKFKLEV